MGLFSSIGRAAKSAGIGKSAAIGIGVLNGATTFYGRRSENPDESMAKTLAYTAAETALYAFLPGVAFAKDAYEMSKALGESGVFDVSRMNAKRVGRTSMGASWDSYQDTEQAATLRQRGIEMMMQSKGAVRGALGKEARALHRGAI